LGPDEGCDDETNGRHGKRGSYWEMLQCTGQDTGGLGTATSGRFHGQGRQSVHRQLVIEEGTTSTPYVGPIGKGLKVVGGGEGTGTAFQPAIAPSWIVPRMDMVHHLGG
jgi:hypothetical protein